LIADKTLTIFSNAAIRLMRIGQFMKFRSFYKTFFFQKKAKSLKQTLSSLGLAVITTIFLCGSANAQAPIENIEGIRSKVAQFLTDEYSRTNAEKVNVRVGKLDNRLRLAKCAQSLELNLKDTAKTGGNINVQVSCSSPTSWTILVPAQAKVYRSVAVAGRNLQRGDVVSAADLSSTVKDVGDFRIGFALTPEAIIGKEVKFAINKGEAFRNSALDAPLVIKRGDVVSMESSSGGISVTISATAISDGRIGQQIRVKNNQSARIINAKVVEAGKVQSIL
jgi:flagella basal body P-ring formation protein FlgA